MRAPASLLVSVVVFVSLGCVERVEVLSPAPDAGAPASAVSDVALGENHGCAVATSRLYCWGNNEFGQLGLGDAAPRDRPTLVAGSWRAVTAGTRHTCALDELGRVACFGQNDRGQLGTGDREARSEPVFVDLPIRATLVTTDFTHTCALLSDATLHCWGKNDEGELGQGDPYPGDQSLDADAVSPVVVPGSWGAVETGQGHTCAIRLDGTLFCWGRNTEHEVNESDDQIQFRAPVQVGTDDDWLAVEAGQSHTCGLREDFFAYCWGDNNSVETGEGAPLGIPGAVELTTPTRVEVADLMLLRTDTFHTCAVDHGAELFCWGRGVEGQLGLGDNELRESPTRVGSGYVAVAVGRFTTCAIAEEGGLSCTGKNDEAQLGTGDTVGRSVFTPVELGE